MDIKVLKRIHDTHVYAIQWDGTFEAAREIIKWLGKADYIPSTKDDPRSYIRIYTPIGTKLIKTGDFIVKSGQNTVISATQEMINAEYSEVYDEDLQLVKHARAELELFPNEDADFLESIMDAVKGFSSYRGHSGSSAEMAIHMLTALLNGQNLLPLTDKEEEWEHKPGADYGIEQDYWQNKRNSSAMSLDGGKTYFLVHEKPGEDGQPVIYTTESKDFVPEIDTEEQTDGDNAEV